MLAERTTARNRAILWLLFDTGMRVSEVCDLRLSDVDLEQGMLLIRGKGVQWRRLTLGYEGLRHLRAYLDTHRLAVAVPPEQRGASQDHLFLSETRCPLTKNGMALLFSRLRKRAGISRKGVNPSTSRGVARCARRRRQAGKPCGSETPPTHSLPNDEKFFSEA
jgi:site-specific recombinase XerD